MKMVYDKFHSGMKYKPFSFLENNLNAYDSRCFFSSGGNTHYYSLNTIPITQKFLRNFQLFCSG